MLIHRFKKHDDDDFDNDVTVNETPEENFKEDDISGEMPIEREFNLKNEIGAVADKEDDSWDDEIPTDETQIEDEVSDDALAGHESDLMSENDSDDLEIIDFNDL